MFIQKSLERNLQCSKIWQVSSIRRENVIGERRELICNVINIVC